MELMIITIVTIITIIIIIIIIIISSSIGIMCWAIVTPAFSFQEMHACENSKLQGREEHSKHDIQQK